MPPRRSWQPLLLPAQPAIFDQGFAPIAVLPVEPIEMFDNPIGSKYSMTEMACVFSGCECRL